MAEDSDLTFSVPRELYERLKADAAILSLTPEEYLRDRLAELLSRPDND